MSQGKIDDIFSFYRGKRVLVTGHTGFKGAWLSFFLNMLGAEVVGYSTCSKESERLSDICGVLEHIYHIKGDVRDLPSLHEVFEKYNPEIVFHLAAQPIVKDSYEAPVDTYSTNVMGTVNVLECIRKCKSVRSVINVTTDKVYKNREWEWGYRENEELDGYDPYSNSKSCSELVTHSYKRCFFDEKSDIAVSTMRAGNVIGGGDVSRDRIIPDCVKAVSKGEKVLVRNPYSIRPYQHVLEPVKAYMMVAKAQFENKKVAGYYNVGPNEDDHISTGELADMFIEAWGDGASWYTECNESVHEANLLKLDCSHIKRVFDWSPVWDVRTAVEKTVEFEKCKLSAGDVKQCMMDQIGEFLGKRIDFGK